MFSVERKVGRLVEYRMAGLVKQDEMEAMMRRFREVVTQGPERKIMVVDIRALRILVPEVADEILKQMRRDNPVLERSAILIGPSALFGLQMERLVRESGNKNRRTFRDEEELLAWVAEVLTPAERARAGDFYREGLVDVHVD